MTGSIRNRRWLARRGILALMFSMTAALQPSSAVAQSGARKSEPATPSGKAFNFFISGHSLNDNPLPEYLAALAGGQGYKPRWNQQMVVGSPIGWRTWGGKGNWTGYREGKNANGQNNMDVVRELRERRGPDAYQALIVAEGHNTLAIVRWHEPARYLRHFHELLIEGNPSGKTYLYEPWEDITDLANPTPWIKLERDASKVWSCVVDRINMSLEHEGRPDRVGSLPIGSGLTTLVERATTEKLPGISGATVTETMKRIFHDNVHLNRIGIYYAALLTYMGVTGETPSKFWQPPGITNEQAASLQQVALQFHRSSVQAKRPMALQDCRRLLLDTFCDDWNRYVPSKWVGPVHDCKPYFARTNMAVERFETPNPFVFDPQSDAAYWHKPPPR